MRARLSVLFVLAAVQGVSAQSYDLSGAGLPSGVAAELQVIIDDPSTRRIAGPGTVGAEQFEESSIAVFDGLLVIAGRVEGHVVVVNGDLVFEEGAVVGGNVTVVGGSMRGAERATLRGTVTVYGEGFSLYRGGTRLLSTVARRDRDRDAYRYDDGRSQIRVNVAENYNRVEGLPLQIGPEIRVGGPWGVRLEALAIWRTAVGSPFDAERLGYLLRAEQFLGTRALRVGATYESTIRPIEDWTLSNIETSLAAALFHEDFRDYFERAGWSAYVRYAPRRSPFELSLEYRDEKHHTVGVRDPWTLFDREDFWRPQPLVAEGDARSIAGSVTADFTHGNGFRTHGVRIDAVVRTVLDADLELVEFAGIRTFDEPFSTAMLDVRGMRRLNGNNVLALRGVAGGAIGEPSLPPQFQHALGGPGSLPGLAAFDLDCGARSILLQRPEDESGDQLYFAQYGCDRFALFQAELRGGFGFRARGHDPRRDGWDWSMDAAPSWIVFYDAARGWTTANGVGLDTRTYHDVGAGVVFGGFGVYGAVPLNGEDRELRLFVRLGPRF